MPRSPSQGGSHEAAVKLFKHHIRRVIGSQQLAVTEFQSLITRIEGCLNSRPLISQAEDAGDELALTPAHFLIGGSADIAAADVFSAEKVSLSSKWRHVQLMTHHFWKRWQMDYINNLQNRNKWRTPKENIAVNDIVIIKEDNCSPAIWALGRVVEVHPGGDGLVRNVTLKTQNGMVKRAVQKLCRLTGCETPEVSPGQDVTASMQ